MITVHGRTVAAGLYEGIVPVDLGVQQRRPAPPTQAGLGPFGHDPTIIVVISVAIILGGLGFPVIIELATARASGPLVAAHQARDRRDRPVLLIVGPGRWCLFEWTNPETLGPLDAATSCWRRGSRA